MSTKRIVSIAAFSLILVPVVVRPLFAQQLPAPTVELHHQISVQLDQRATMDVPSDTTTDTFTKRHGMIGVGLGFLIPGAGQIYAGSYVKGAILLGISFGAVQLANRSCADDTDGVDAEACVGNTILGLGVIAGAWAYGMISAPGDARDYNEKHARSAAAIAPVLDRHAGRTGLGLALRY